MLPDGQRIGLLGGSFNPAHEGHIHLSEQAKKRLKLDKIIWLVSPQNPLKSREGMAPYEQRLSYAVELTQSIPFIAITDFEQQEQLHYSIDTVAALQQCYPRTSFVWLMGADNFASFHRWYRWDDVMRMIPVAVFDRAPFSHAALRQKTARAFAVNRLKESEAAMLPFSIAPAWVYCFMPRHPLSATHLRKTLGEQAFDMAYYS